jgi:hypothetical protein
MAIKGAITLNEVSIIEVDADPSVTGQGATANVGSVAILSSTGALFSKIGINSTDWVEKKNTYRYTNSSTATNSTVTYGSIAQLTSVSLPVGLYKFYFSGLVQSSGTNQGGIGLRISNVSATVSTVYAKWKIPQAANGTTKNFIYDQLSATTDVTSASTNAANTNQIADGSGVFRVTAAGTVAIQLRSETDTVTATLGVDASFIIEPA